MKFTVIIPVFNEAKTVGKIIEQVSVQKCVDKIIIVNDGSTDDTPKILKSIKDSKIKVVTQLKNMGKGAAIKVGLKEIDGGYFIIQDADLEYDPAQYPSLLSFAKPNVVVYGSRLLEDNNEHAYFATYFGNVLLTKMFNILYGVYLTDAYTCYKLLPVGVAKSLALSSNGFEIEAEITAKLAKSGVKIVEVPINFNPRSYEEGKKIKAKDALIGLWTFLKVRLSW